MINQKLVSVCIPTYNGGKFLEQSLNSIRNQTYKNIEVIISDDHSKDNTLQIAEKFKKEVDFPVFIYVHEPQGIGANWNNCIRKANGVFIKFLFQDDLLNHNCIEKLIEPFRRHRINEIVMTACKRSIIIEEGAGGTESWMHFNKDLQKDLEPNEDNNYLLGKELFRNYNFLKNPKNKIGEPPVTLIKKSVFDEVGLFEEDLIQILDFEFYYRVLKRNKILVLNEKLVSFRLHADQATNKNRNRNTSDYNKYYRLLYDEYFWYLNFKNKKKLLKRFTWFGKFYLRLRYGE